jgi:hypothetical protein
MTKETFKSQLTTLCASALAAGIIDLDRFNALMQFSNPVTAQKKSVRIKKNTWTSTQWTPEMFRLATGLAMQGWSNKSIAREINKNCNVSISDRSVQTMLWKIKSGDIHQLDKYNAEPLRSVVRNCAEELQKSYGQSSLSV